MFSPHPALLHQNLGLSPALRGEMFEEPWGPAVPRLPWWLALAVGTPVPGVRAAQLHRR